MKRSFILFFVLVAMIQSAFCAEQSREIKIASEEWRNATNGDGTGLFWDIFRAVFEAEGIKINIIIRSYKGSEELLKRNLVDAQAGTYLNEIEGAVFPKNHFAEDVIVVAFKKSSGINWKGEESLRNAKVAWLKGYSLDQYIRVPMKAAELTDRKAALRAMGKEKRFDFFIDSMPDLITAMEQENIDKNDFRIEVLKRLNLYLAFQGTKKGKELADIFDRRFEELLKSGEIKKIYEKSKDSHMEYPF